MNDFSKKVLEWKSKGRNNMFTASRELRRLRQSYREDRHNLLAGDYDSKIKKIKIELDAIRVAMIMIDQKCDEISNNSYKDRQEFFIASVQPKDIIGFPDWNQPNIDERLKDGKFLDKPESKIGHIPELKRCDCGAKHTAFPNHHSNWCTAKEWN